MNPAVAFKPVAGAAHSVVLTSGTLAPLEGFASEVRQAAAGGGDGWGRTRLGVGVAGGREAV